MVRDCAVVTLGIVLLLVTVGCTRLQSSAQVDRPARHSVSTKSFVVQSDFRIPADHPLIRELEEVREQVVAQLELPAQRDQVVVYLFSDESAYRTFMETTWPSLPDRRAYFVGTSRELAVYSFWSDRVREDLRHEFTHGLLHATLSDVPLWLDEGLAEYFEVPGTAAGTPNSAYVSELIESTMNGWRPDIQRLEALEDFSRMTQKDYQEAWAWVHFMLHGDESARAGLLSYVGELRNDDHPLPLSSRLSASVPRFNDRMLVHVSQLSHPGTMTQLTEY